MCERIENRDSNLYTNVHASTVDNTQMDTTQMSISG